MDVIETMQKEEQDYKEAIKKAIDFKDSFDKLSPQNKERLLKELSHGAVTIQMIDEIIRMFKGGGI